MENLEIDKEFIEKHSLTEDVVTALTELTTKHVDNVVAETKKEYDGKANTDAEAILTGAADKIKDETKIERKQGEKLADYYSRAWVESNTTKTKALEDATNDYLEKAKGVEGNEAITKEFNTLKDKHDDVLKQLVDFDSYKEKAEKLEPLEEQHNKMKEEVAFGTVKPNFPKEVNEFEAKAKWDEFKSSVQKDWDIELVDGEAVAVNKDNPHKTEKLKDLLESNESIAKLLKGREQGGPGGKEAELQDVEGVPFKVPVDADNKKISELINKHLATKNIAITDPSYSAKFKELHDKIKESKKAA